MNSHTLGHTSAVCLLLGFAAILSPACGSDDEVGDGELGASCDPADEASCNDDLVCGEKGDAFACAYAPGASCDGELENGGCADDASCESVATNEGMGGAGAEEALCLLKEGSLCDPEEPYCGPDMTCATTTEDETRCFGKVIIRGDVTSTEDTSAIEGAHVISLDEEGSAVTDVAVSGAEGEYVLELPVVRDEDGFPIEATFTLNAAAQDFQPFPKGARVALPLSTEEVVEDGPFYVIENALTSIGLIPLPEEERYRASGAVEGLSEQGRIAGLLVVATGDAGTFTAITDLTGQFTLFNLVPGDYTVKAYGDGIQVSSETISISDSSLSDVVLEELDEDTTTVSGNIQIVNAPGGAVTSVILVVKDTFDENAARGEVPRGLRAPKSGPVDVDGDFSIEGVPEGTYVALAAYENDDLVRDPDTNISGTDFVTIEVKAGDDDIDLEESFKVTEALHIESPGSDGPEAVEKAPVLEWADDSSEDWYELQVYDAFGNAVYDNPIEIPGVSGSDTVSYQYDGPLEPGMYYQFRVSSWRQPGKGDPAPISTTEDLKGVFFLPGEE